MIESFKTEILQLDFSVLQSIVMEVNGRLDWCQMNGIFDLMIDDYDFIGSHFQSICRRPFG